MEMAQTPGRQPTYAKDQAWYVYRRSLTDAAPRSGGGARRFSPGPDFCRDAQGVKDLARAGISQRFWESETQVRSPKDKDRLLRGLDQSCPSRSNPKSSIPEGPTNFGAAERRGWFAVGGWSREPLLSSTCSGSASAQPLPTPFPQPHPRHQTPQLSSPSFSSPLALLPHFPLGSSFVFSPPSPPRLPLASSGPQGRRRARCTLGPHSSQGGVFPTSPGEFGEGLCVRARVSRRRKRVGSSGEQRVRVFDVSRRLHKPRGARKSVSESACVYTGWLPLAHSVARGPGARGPLWRPGITVTSH